jgi:hypothetical protein
LISAARTELRAAQMTRRPQAEDTVSKGIATVDVVNAHLGCVIEGNFVKF